MSIFRKFSLAALCVGIAAGVAFGQDVATLTLAVSDPSAAVVPGAEISATENARGTVYRKATTAEGFATFDALTPGEYTISVTKAGFAVYTMEHVSVNARDRLILRVQLTVAAAATAAIDVKATSDPLSTDPAEKISLDHDFLANTPVSGRNVESLILLTPGITAAGANDGGFNVNGMRSNTNYYTIDGVSSNRDVTGGGPAGGGGGRGGGFAGGLAAGGGNSPDSVAIDALQELRVQTSSFAPEFGRTPGAQISLTTRAGSNGFHGTASYYLRNDRFDANDYFANAYGLGRGKEHQNRPGIAFGGPIVKNKTFFFLSFEDLMLTAPYSVIVNVPDLNTRKSVPAGLRPYLNAFPLPNGPSLATGTAQFRALVSNPYDGKIGSIRVDHTLTARINLFGRASFSPNNTDQRGSDLTSPNVLTHRDTTSETFTVGMTRTSPHGAVNDLRVNYSKYKLSSTGTMDTYGGAVPLTDAQVFPKGVTSATGTFSLNVIGLGGYSLGGFAQNQQQQINVVDSLTKTAEDHLLKVGVDYRRSMATNYRRPYTASVSFNGVANDTGIFSGTALNGQVSSNLTAVYPTYDNFSLYAQDAWRLSKDFTVTYGLRWDVNPAPTTRSGPKPFALSSSTIAGVTQNDPIYDTRWSNIAPRVGAAYQVNSARGHEMVVRGGFGTFYDVGYGASGAASFNGAPFSNTRTLTSVRFPLVTSNLLAPSLPPVRPYDFISTAQTGLLAPRVYQWNATIEKNLGFRRTLTVGYAGTSGTNLLRVANQPSFTTAYNVLSLTDNGATSTYHALQVQYRQRIASSLQVQLGYTYSHSIDTASNDAGFTGFASIFRTGNGEKGSSDFDIRHSVFASGSYHVWAPKSGIAFAPIRNWFVDFTGFYRTGLPFNITGISTAASGTNSSTTSPGGLFAQVRPNLTGAAIWISDAHAPGGEKLNPLAFSLPNGYQQGNLGRNELRGFSAHQEDVSLRRVFPIGERFRVTVAATGYNILNHANFANPSPQEGANLSSPEFGLVTRMLNQGFGGSGGTTSLYRSGGPRSMELSLRLQF